MGVTVTPSNGPEYTWATSAWTWNSAQAGVTWAVDYGISYDVQVTETVATAESLSKAFQLKKSETTAFAESRMASAQLVKSETVALAESRASSVSKVIAEAFATSDSISKAHAKSLAESLGIADSYRNAVGKAISEAFGLLDNLGTILAKYLELPFSESLAISDDRRATLALAISELLACTEAFGRVSTWYLNQTESLTIAESSSRNPNQVAAETIAVAESRTSAVQLNRSEMVALAELPASAVAKTLAEAFAASDSISKQSTINSAETIVIVDGGARQVDKSLAEALAVADSYSRTVQFFMDLQESLGVASGDLEENLKEPLTISEAISIVSAYSNTIGHRPLETLAISELLSKGSSKALSETITFADSESKAVTMTAAEVIAIVEAYIRKANAVFSNMIVSLDDISKPEFEAMLDSGRVPGYESFREFIPGNYQYQKALFRTILESVNSDRAMMSQLKVTADVPDVFDRGTVTIAAGQEATGVTVDFARQFLIVPDVQLTLKSSGGAIGIPTLISVTETHFTVMLKNPTTGEGMAGTLTWAAHGY